MNELYNKFMDSIDEAASNWYCWQLYNFEAQWGERDGLEDDLFRTMKITFPMFDRERMEKARKRGYQLFRSFCKLHPEIY